MGIEITNWNASPFDEVKPLPEPEDGWKEVTCDWKSHRWAFHIEDGRIRIECLDPCDLTQFNPSGPLPVCDTDYLVSEDFYSVNPIEVKLRFVDDSTPDSWLGPAEYGYYIEVYNLTDEVPQDKRRGGIFE